MRCIETEQLYLDLKVGELINYNMRCIETEEADRLHMAGDLINYNMRCIETLDGQPIASCENDKLQHEMY